MTIMASSFRGACVRLATLCAGFTALVFGADPALTIYNQNFAVIRETLPLDLKAGDNITHYSGVTEQVEPDSVILRDPAGKHAVQVVEQNYRNDPLSPDILLHLFEGKTIEFLMPGGRTVSGTVVRSGYVPRSANQGYMQQRQPVVAVGGKLQFSLPGTPIYPDLGVDTILEPTLDWILRSGQAARFDAELSYVSGGLTWKSDYNVVAPETGDKLDLIVWVTLDNGSGKQFEHAHIKLMAGDVNKVEPSTSRMFAIAGTHLGLADTSVSTLPAEQAFEDYHLYTLPNPTTLRDRETKQVEFLRASGIQSKRLYIYDGATLDSQYRNQDLRQNQQYGTQSNPHVWIMREFVNSEANHLGVPLPKGRVRFYRRDQDGQMEFRGK